MLVLIKYVPTVLFTAFAVQLMILKEFTYASGLISLILGFVAFGFTFFDTRKEIIDIEEKIDSQRETFEIRVSKLEKQIEEATSVLNAVKMQNKLTNKRF